MIKKEWLFMLTEPKMEILTPYKRAKNIMHKIYKINQDSAKQLAIVFVNEMILENYDLCYWKKVKEELKKLQ
jgi:hypothetical protein